MVEGPNVAVHGDLGEVVLEDRLGAVIELAQDLRPMSGSVKTQLDASYTGEEPRDSQRSVGFRKERGLRLTTTHGGQP
jgi:hypothetical protein